jgi:hypothetical protein
MSCSEDTLLSTVTLMCCSVAGGHSAGCRTTWLCLQHHATVVISYCVKICGNNFPPTVSKHCQHQPSAISKPYKQYEIRTIQAVVIYKVLLPQSNIMTAFVHSHCNLFSDASLDLPTYKGHEGHTIYGSI